MFSSRPFFVIGSGSATMAPYLDTLAKADEMSNQSEKVQSLVDQLKALDKDAAKQVIDALQKEEILAGCIIWRCNLVHHYHRGPPK
jgi:hypothetical protein